MSRHDYREDFGCDWDWVMWRGAVASATRGARGQKLLRDLRDALDAMPVKELISHALQTQQGAVCALGSVGAHNGVNMAGIDAEDADQVADTFDVAPALAREIMYENDDAAPDDPAKRWKYMRNWVEKQIMTG